MSEIMSKENLKSIIRPPLLNGFKFMDFNLKKSSKYIKENIFLQKLETSSKQDYQQNQQLVSSIPQMVKLMFQSNQELLFNSFNEQNSGFRESLKNSFVFQNGNLKNSNNSQGNQITQSQVFQEVISFLRGEVRKEQIIQQLIDGITKTIDSGNVNKLQLEVFQLLKAQLIKSFQSLYSSINQQSGEGQQFITQLLSQILNNFKEQQNMSHQQEVHIQGSHPKLFKDSLLFDQPEIDPIADDKIEQQSEEVCKQDNKKLERLAKIARYKQKKRNWYKKIQYECRKKTAQKRLRIQGRFLSNVEGDKIKQAIDGGFEQNGNLNIEVARRQLNCIRKEIEMKNEIGYHYVSKDNILKKVEIHLKKKKEISQLDVMKRISRRQKIFSLRMSNTKLSTFDQ